MAVNAVITPAVFRNLACVMGEPSLTFSIFTLSVSRLIGRLTSWGQGNNLLRCRNPAAASHFVLVQDFRRSLKEVVRSVCSAELLSRGMILQKYRNWVIANCTAVLCQRAGRITLFSLVSSATSVLVMQKGGQPTHLSKLAGQARAGHLSLLGTQIMRS
jgi:hypothetical protein